MGDWFYAKETEQFGPIPLEKLKKLFQRGKLTGEHLVWTEGMEEWVPAASIPDLVPPPPAPSHSSVESYTDDLVIQMSKEPFYYHISWVRFAVFNLLSFGLFQLYWMYRNWKYVQTWKREPIRPFWRAVFGVFYLHALLSAILEEPRGRRTGIEGFPVKLLTGLWILSAIIEWYGDEAYWSYEYPILFQLFSLSIVIFFIPPHRYILQVNQRLNLDMPHTPWYFGQIFCLILGGILWWVYVVDLYSYWFW